MSPGTMLIQRWSPLAMRLSAAIGSPCAPVADDHHVRGRRGALTSCRCGSACRAAHADSPAPGPSRCCSPGCARPARPCARDCRPGPGSAARAQISEPKVAMITRPGASRDVAGRARLLTSRSDGVKPGVSTCTQSLTAGSSTPSSPMRARASKVGLAAVHRRLVELEVAGMDDRCPPAYGCRRRRRRGCCGRRGRTPRSNGPSSHPVAGLHLVQVGQVHQPVLAAA